MSMRNNPQRSNRNATEESQQQQMDQCCVNASLTMCSIVDIIGKCRRICRRPPKPDTRGWRTCWFDRSARNVSVSECLSPTFENCSESRSALVLSLIGFPIVILLIALRHGVDDCSFHFGFLYGLWNSV